MTQQNEAIRLAIEALQSAKEEYWDDHHSDMSEGDFENHWLIMDICKAMKALRPLLDQTSAGVGDGEYGIIDAIEWADGVAGALGSEYASRVTDEEIAVAMAIKSALTQADQPADSFVAAGEWAIVPKRLSLPMAQAVENNIDGEGNLYDCWYSMMLNAAPQPPDEYLAGRWLPVDTAPKQNGERVLLALIEDERWLWVTIGWWNKKSKAWWHNPDGRLIPPSHWMPLPSPAIQDGAVMRALGILSQYYGQMPRDDYDSLDAFIRSVPGVDMKGINLDRIEEIAAAHENYKDYMRSREGEEICYHTFSTRRLVEFTTAIWQLGFSEGSSESTPPQADLVKEGA